jgi:CheY-like chemotaxis protein
MAIAEYACVFVRPPKERLAIAMRLVVALPSYLGADGECDLHHCGASGYLAAVLRGPVHAFTPEVLARLGFWTARTGARGFAVGALSADEAARFRAELNLCEHVVRGTATARVEEVARLFFRRLGVAAGAAPVARPALYMDLDGPGGGGARYHPERRALFVAGVLAPPRGEQLALVVRDREAARPIQGWATVVDVRPREQAGPGRPAGFTLRIEGPSALHERLSRHASEAPLATGTRAAPRFHVNAPVKVTPLPPQRPQEAPPRAPPSEPSRTPPPRARVEYATDQELAADWLENLSHGGAFVRTAATLPQGAEVALELALPDGARLDARAMVAFSSPKGMGLRFVLSPEQEGVLAAAIARISARPRRALLVDDDALQRAMIADALTARGFEVLTADDGAAGLRRLSEEILALDLLVTDVVMPGLDGEAFVRTIRKAGGEGELAIVAVSGALEPGVEERLEAAGADAVLDKALGPELIAQAADAALERKRLVARADAA